MRDLWQRLVEMANERVARSLWDPGPREEWAPELERMFANLKLPTPGEFKKAWAAHLVTHCEHGKPRAEHCPWCYVQTAAYRQSLADAMWTILD